MRGTENGKQISEVHILPLSGSTGDDHLGDSLAVEEVHMDETCDDQLESSCAPDCHCNTPDCYLQYVFQ